MEDSQAKAITHEVMRDHKVIPQFGEFLPNGDIALLCSCSDMQDYNYNGYMAHLEVKMYDAIEDRELNPNPKIHSHPFGEANCTICHP